MKKAYWLAPLAVLILFVFAYRHELSSIDAKALAEKEARKLEIQRKNEENARRTEEAAKLRREETDRKKKADAEEAELKAKEEQYLRDIDYARDFAKRESARYENVVKELTESFETEKKARDGAEKTIESMRDEKKFIVEYVAKAQANEKALKDLLQKLAALDAERAKLAANKD